MNRREFMKLLGFGLPALMLVRPEIKLENSKPKPIKEFSIPSIWTGTNGTATTGTITVYPDDGKPYYVYDKPLEQHSWSTSGSASMTYTRKEMKEFYSGGIGFDWEKDE